MRKEEIITIVKEHICEVIPELSSDDFQLSDSLQYLGANSVERAEILMLIMESMSLQIPRIELFGTNNIGELVDLLHEKV